MEIENEKQQDLVDLMDSRHQMDGVVKYNKNAFH